MIWPRFCDFMCYFTNVLGFFLYQTGTRRSISLICSRSSSSSRSGVCSIDSAEIDIMRRSACYDKDIGFCSRIDRFQLIDKHTMFEINII